MTCSICGEEFPLLPDHPGYANVCRNCGGRDVVRKMAKVSYPSKHVTDALIEIVDNPEEAIYFNALQARNTAGVMTSSFRSVSTKVWQREAGKDWEPPEQPERHFDSKRGTGAENRALYYSNLGEKRTVKL